MNYQLDVSKGYQVSKKHFLLLSLLFSLIFTVVLISDVLLVVLSNENYIVALIISIVITVLFTWFAIYFFYNIYSDVNNEYRFYKGYESGLKEIGEVIYINQDTELTYINGLYAYPVHVAYINGLEKTNKVIYTIEKLDYRQGDKLSIITYRRILVKAELHP
ncbi:MAG: hypothetical protein J5617_03625 [Bacilli bacterium]|nr:hypothetical protein [Bacilli bacterium]